VGYVDAAGFLYLTDCKAFMIVSGGVNIYPQQVELPRHPTGKLYKRLLRDRYWQGRESRIV
jgi:acyl-CoA synthetase (AMP-forming)/AMP-acid ligase II